MLEELYLTLKHLTLAVVISGALVTIAIQWDKKENADTVYTGATPDCKKIDNTLPPTYTE